MYVKLCVTPLKSSPAEVRPYCQFRTCRDLRPCHDPLHPRLYPYRVGTQHRPDCWWQYHLLVRLHWSPAHDADRRTSPGFFFKTNRLCSATLINPTLRFPFQLADITTLRWRGFASGLVTMPFVINSTPRVVTFVPELSLTDLFLPISWYRCRDCCEIKILDRLKFKLTVPCDICSSASFPTGDGARPFSQSMLLQDNADTSVTFLFDQATACLPSSSRPASSPLLSFFSCLSTRLRNSLSSPRPSPSVVASSLPLARSSPRWTLL